MVSLRETLQAHVQHEVERYNALNDKVTEAEQRVLALREERMMALGSVRGTQELLEEVLREESLSANGHPVADPESA